MSKGGFRPNSGRKKGSVPWNVGVPMSEESKAKLSASKKGTPSWNKGVPMREETKLLQSKQRKGKKLWPDGREFTGEWRHKMSLAKIGKTSSNKGKKLSQEQRLQASIRRRAYLERVGFNYSYEEKDVLRRDRKAVRLKRIKTNGGSHSVGEWNNLKLKYNFTCLSCKKREPEIKLTRDHIVSLSNKGTDSIENIQPLCVSCNSKKSTQSIKY